MEHAKMLKKLMELGISEKEARIYSALLQKRELTAIEIQKTAHVPRTKVYEITHKMILSNMCIEKQIGGRKKYQAVEPKKFLKSLMKKNERELIEKRKLAGEIEKIASPEYARGMQKTDISKSVEIIRDQPSIHERYLNLLRNTKKELVGLVKPPYVHQYNELRLGEQDEIMFRKIKKGVKVRMLYEIPVKKIKWTYSYIKKCVERGEKARVIASVPAKINIFDQRYIVVALTNLKPGASPLTMFVIEHPPLARAGKILFDYLWAQAQNYHSLKSLIRKRDTKH